ncbi:MAG: hypothetical protein KTR22_09540 [Flavobacteriaceae bacterium]|nr:hypothetical protein [Flavobacteriaceae bacterium]
MNFNKPIYIAIALFLSSCFCTFAQDSGEIVTQATEETTEKPSVQPLRIGVKAGAPIIISLNAEYLTSLLDNRVAFAVDYAPFSITVSDVDLKAQNFEIGSNIYFGNKGKGWYAGISYFNFNTEATILDVDFDDGTFGEGNTTLKFNTINAKIGVKSGRTFYIRAELGYSFGSLPDSLRINSTEGNSFTTEPIDEISVLTKSGLPLFNFGFGFSFL